jgi:hypothetical protein
MPRHALNYETQLPHVYIAGNYFDAGMGGSTRSTIAGVATRLVVYPFVPIVDISVDRAAIDVTTNVASAQARIVIYDSDGTNMLPNTNLYDSAELDCGTATGIQEVTLSFTFEAGHLYWVGVHNSSTATLRGIPISDCRQVAVIGTSGGAVYTGYRRDVAFGTDSPAPFGTPTLSNQIMPQVKFRIA